MRCYVTREIDKTRRVMEKLLCSEQILTTLETIAEVCVDSLHSNGKIMFCGNGGSAADSQHLAGELVSRLNFDRPGLAAVALTTDSAVMTAVGNDYGYEQLFARQIEALGREGDVLVAASTSGNSPNVLEALKAAREKGIATVGLTGNDGGEMTGLCDYLIIIPSRETPKIQEGHIVLGHVLCGLIETTMFAE